MIEVVKKRRSPIKHRVKEHTRSDGTVVKSHSRGQGGRKLKSRVRTQSLTDAEFYPIIGRIQTHRNKKDLVRFKREFKRRFNKAKWIYRGISLSEYADLLRTKTSEGVHFTLDVDIARSWARDDDVVIAIRKPESSVMHDYEINDSYFSELEVLVPKGTRVRGLREVKLKRD